MKKIRLLILSLTTMHCFAQYPLHNSRVPDEVLTGDTVSWTISTLSTMGYVNKTSGPGYNTFKGAGGMTVTFNFKKNGRFVFRLYVQANSYGTETETWTEVEGTVEFKKDASGQAIFVTRAEKGMYRISKNGQTSTRAISRKELAGQHSNTYIWERFTFPDDPAHTYLLVVDLDAHPEANMKVPGSIDKSWVSRFHIPVKN